MHRSMKQQLLQKSSQLLLQNTFHEANHMGADELSDELGDATTHRNANKSGLLDAKKR